MSLRAGFAEIDVSPTKFPVATYFSSSEEIMDPLFAHAAVFDDGATTLALLSFDVVIVKAEYVKRIRDGIASLKSFKFSKSCNSFFISLNSSKGKTTNSFIPFFSKIFGCNASIILSYL